MLPAYIIFLPSDSCSSSSTAPNLATRGVACGTDPPTMIHHHGANVKSLQGDKGAPINGPFPWSCDVWVTNGNFLAETMYEG